MGALRDKMENEMLLRGYSPRTRKTYIGIMKAMTKHYGRSPMGLTEKDIENYLIYVTKERGYRAASVNLARAAILFFYRNILNIEGFGNAIAKQRLPVRRPVILSREEIQLMLESTQNIKHRALLMTAYSAGLRVSELVGLRVRDIDSRRMLIRVEEGKGKKDRYTILAKTTLQYLREYYREYRPEDLLFFNPKNKRKAYTIRSAESVFTKAVKRAGIMKNVSIHNLRHSFATHMLEDGVALPYIQMLLGHSSPKTTGIYLGISENDFRKCSSPLDRIFTTEKVHA